MFSLANKKAICGVKWCNIVFNTVQLYTLVYKFMYSRVRCVQSRIAVQSGVKQICDKYVLISLQVKGEIIFTSMSM